MSSRTGNRHASEPDRADYPDAKAPASTAGVFFYPATSLYFQPFLSQ